ncbi:MAG: hypothetical protein JSR93_10710 [Verrucomicrobia bacterium]|nr:hypothetical protein [Verrucomicrobiota bacterium]
MMTSRLEANLAATNSRNPGSVQPNKNPNWNGKSVDKSIIGHALKIGSTALNIISGIARSLFASNPTNKEQVSLDRGNKGLGKDTFIAANGSTPPIIADNYSSITVGINKESLSEFDIDWNSESNAIQ